MQGRRIILLLFVCSMTLCVLLGGSAIAAGSAQAPPLSPASHIATAASGPSLTAAPLSPAFTAYLKLHSAARSSLGSGSSQPGLGLIPSPIDFSYLEVKSRSAVLMASVYPSSYDLRAHGKLSPIEDQGKLNTCWAFAALGSLESCSLPADPEVFSEDNLVLASGFDGDLYSMGGNGLKASAYLARWAGPVSANKESYGGSNVPPGLVAEKHVQNVDFLPPRTSALDNDGIKRALMNDGAIYTGLYVDASVGGPSNSSTWNASNAAYYYSGSAQPNHAVDIVGWDDSYSRNNFSTTPPGDGAFLVRNSWGTSFGKSGYFYVSYYDSQIGFQSYTPSTGGDVNAVFNDAEPADNYNGIYQYDPLGWTSCNGYGSDQAWFANSFTARSSDELAAVSFFAAEPGSTYTVYASVGPSYTLTTEASGSCATAGYHTITLSSPKQLTAGQHFLVVVDLTTPGYNYPIPLETNIAGYSSASTPSGESFASADGLAWTNLANANVCLKAFTRAAGPTDLTAPTTSVAGADVTWHDSPVTLAFSAVDTGSGVAYTEFEVDGTGWKKGSTVTISAPADHSNDGVHTVLYRSADNAGNVETPHSCQVMINTKQVKPPAPTFSDVGPTTLYSVAIADLSSRGIVSGFPDGTFRPEGPVTRQQFAKMIVLALGLPVSVSDVCPFADVDHNVDPTDPLYPDHYVAVCAAHAITEGTSPGYFSPSSNVTTAQMITMVVRAAQSLNPGAVKTPPSDWSGVLPSDDPTHGANIRIAEYSHLLDGVDLPSLDIAANATRGLVAQMLDNLRNASGA